MDCFNYPLDTETLLRKKRRLRKELLAQNPHPLQKRIAILGGSTTNEVADQLGLFLLQYGIQAEFYQSEYGQYWQDAMFGTPELDGFHPDVIYIHTNWRNIINFPTTATPQAEIDAMLNAEYSRFEQMWQALEAKFHCPVIQNNFDRPNYRLMGNRDIWDPHGRSNYLSRLNQRFYAYAAAHEDFYINDIDYLSADYGLTAWGDAFFWHMYKYAMCLDAIPSLANSVANIIKSLYGRNKKALVLDLDKKAEAFSAERPESVKITAKRFKELVKEAQEEYGLTERNRRRLRQLDDFMTEHFRVTFGNRIRYQIERYVPAYVACGGEELSALDDILAKKVMRKLGMQNPVYLRNNAENLCRYMDELFGEENLSQCKEIVRRLGRSA